MIPPFYRIAERLVYRIARLRGSLLAVRIRWAGGRCGTHLWLGHGVVIKYPLHAGISLGNSVRIGEYCVLDIPIGARLAIGDDVTLTMGVVLAARHSIDLGDNSLVGEYSSLRDSDHGTQPGHLIRKQEMISLPVSVGSDVWLGRGVCVLKGVSIGDGAVVGANAVVVKSLPPYSVSVGAPAKVVRLRK